MKILSLPVSCEPDVGELAEQRLHESPYHFLKRLKCDIHEGVLTLRGHVPYPQLASCAEAIVSRVDGVDAIINCLEIGEPAEMAGGLRRGA